VVLALIRVQFLKRFESSARGFERSCERLLIKLLTFVTLHAESDAVNRLDLLPHRFARRIRHALGSRLKSAAWKRLGVDAPWRVGKPDAGGMSIALLLRAVDTAFAGNGEGFHGSLEEFPGIADSIGLGRLDLAVILDRLGDREE